MAFIPQSGKKQTLPVFNLETLPMAMREVEVKWPILVLTDDVQQAKQLFLAWQFFESNKKVIYFPDWELLPYERFSPYHDLVSERLSALWHMANNMVDVVIMPVATAMQKLPPVSFIMDHTVWLEVAQDLNLESFRQNLVTNGYQYVSQVVSPREFSIRGGIIDLFPMGAQFPYRIDLLDNEIDSIRTFDPITQRTIKKVSSIRLLSAYEFPTDEVGIQIFKTQFRDIIDSPVHEANVYQAVAKGIFGAGVEFYFPLFFEENTATILDYLSSDVVVIQNKTLPIQAGEFEKDVKSRYILAGGDVAYPPLAPNYLYLDANEFQGLLKPKARIVWQVEQAERSKLPKLSINRDLKDPIQPLKQFIQNFSGRILLLADSLGRSETIINLAQQNDLIIPRVNSWQEFLKFDQKLAILLSPDFQQGFILPELNLALVTESDLYQNNSRRVTKKRKYQSVSENAFMDLAEINIGDFVVHENHGIGLYKGLVNLGLDGQPIEEFMLLEYKDNAQLYVPVSQLNLISRYRGQNLEAVQLHALGQEQWSRQKQKALQKTWDTAAELLNIYAQRELKQGFSYSLDIESYQNFVDGFEYEETEDQAKAIEQTLHDLAKNKPMDRLICGDVGFGKTEVALRAAFVVAMSGKQVAILAPTTLLVEQHTETFMSRFANFPIRIESVSRFVSKKKTQEILQDLKEGKIDIIIGTHKLIHADVQFKNMGLLVIDEEHRFGVRQKEELKKYRSQVDVLTMTATPIPRTLSMALEQLRDFSLIATAPEKRLAVKTMVQPFSEAVVQEAILREMKRNGQIFFLHNEVSTIENMRNKLLELVPHARTCVAHGQMHERELEQVMRSFLRHQYDVMVCSTIIETGIDIPNVNTIIINRADKFGIAQLHQLRGRVGRSYHQAYAYLLTPEYLSSEARKRLEAIERANELGAGFFLAMQDLEIRGSGEILGDNQSGDMIKVGLNLYTEMLRRAVRDIRQGKSPDSNHPLKITSEIKLYSPALLPEDYCPDVHERLVLYKKLAQAENKQRLDDILEELIDRFGLLPCPAKLLIEIHYLRLIAEQMGIQYVDASTEQISILFDKNTTVDPVSIIQLIQMQPDKFQLQNGTKLVVRIAQENPEKRVQEIKKVLMELR
ncbi:MAG: transcription-repair coupling factor [Neisseriaceae bacterium]|nr:MAG: transcription-repair coupling factor [Neisseriaceae bacterium]